MVARESAVPIMMAERHAREANMARTRDGCTLRTRRVHLVRGEGRDLSG
jgi:hypothetical protein